MLLLLLLATTSSVLSEYVELLSIEQDETSNRYGRNLQSILSSLNKKHNEMGYRRNQKNLNAMYQIDAEHFDDSLKDKVKELRRFVRINKKKDENRKARKFHESLSEPRRTFFGPDSMMGVSAVDSDDDKTLENRRRRKRSHKYSKHRLLKYGKRKAVKDHNEINKLLRQAPELAKILPWRRFRRANPIDAESEFKMQYAMPIHMKIQGYLQMPR